MSYIVVSNELYHYGVKGMKWRHHLRRSLGFSQRIDYMREKKKTDYMTSNSSRVGSSLNRAKDTVDYYRQLREGGHEPRGQYQKNERDNAVDLVPAYRSIIHEQRVRESEAYKKYSQTPLGKIESVTSGATKAVSDFINRLFKKDTKKDPFKNFKNSIKRNSYIAAVKRENNRPISRKKNVSGTAKTDWFKKRK